jgi:triacylglycerol esterase/lipase EstA (alpha/beta hydrolase family)
MHRSLVWFFSLFITASAMASPHEARLPLPRFLHAESLVATPFIDGLNHALGDGCRVSLRDHALVIHLDREKLPASCDAAKLAVRVFTSYAAPGSTAAQAQNYGLRLPRNFDPNRRLVILVHGLDCNHHFWDGFLPLFDRDGEQVATFSYPSSQGIADSADLFAQHLSALHEEFPDLQLDLVTHSMGSLIARLYVEGPAYRGNVHHLIMLTPPNHGSTWVRAEIFAKAIDHYQQYRHDPQWHWTWMLTDGLGEAARDLAPKSAMIHQLDSLSRRPGVEYTIVAGDQNPAWHIAAGVAAAPARWVPKRISNWWGIRQTRHVIEAASRRLDRHKSDNDGPVSLRSARLDGVDDFVILHADHSEMLNWHHGSPPASWETIRDRLSR